MFGGADLSLVVAGGKAFIVGTRGWRELLVSKRSGTWGVEVIAVEIFVRGVTFLVYLRGAIVIRTHHHIHKNLYYTFFANHIWSLLICSPVIFSSKYSGLIGSIFYQVCLQPLGSGFHFVCR